MINPDFAEAHDNLGVFLLSQNRVADALTHLRRAVELAPGLPDPHNDLGAALAQAGKLDEAIAHVRRALEISPDHAPARQNLAILRGAGTSRETSRSGVKAREVRGEVHGRSGWKREVRSEGRGRSGVRAGGPG